MISISELSKRTGISEAALNSYVALGILPKPQPRTSAAGAREDQGERYFPESALARVEEVRRLVSAGLPMSEIAGRFSAVAGISGPVSAKSLGYTLSPDDIAHPAYILNRSFELTWCNELARKEILGFGAAAAGAESRNIFLLLLDAYGDDSGGRRDSLLRLHLAFAKARLSRLSMSGLLRNVEPRHAQSIARMYDEAPIVSGQSVAEIPYSLDDDTGSSKACKAYGIFLRDGILIVHTLG